MAAPFLSLACGRLVAFRLELCIREAEFLEVYGDLVERTGDALSSKLVDLPNSCLYFVVQRQQPQGDGGDNVVVTVCKRAQKSQQTFDIRIGIGMGKRIAVLHGQRVSQVPR